MDKLNNIRPGFGHLMGFISRFAMIYFKKKMKRFQINGQQMGILMMLSQNDGISQDEIVGHIFLNKATVGRHLQGLEKKGMILRKNSSIDHRINQVFLTKDGKKLIPLFLDTAHDWQEIMTRGLTASEIKSLEKILKKITLNISEEFGVIDRCKEIL